MVIVVLSRTEIRILLTMIPIKHLKHAPSFRTKMCRSVQLNTPCSRERCTFAHAEEKLITEKAQGAALEQMTPTAPPTTAMQVFVPSAVVPENVIRLKAPLALNSAIDVFNHGTATALAVTIVSSKVQELSRS